MSFDAAAWGRRLRDCPAPSSRRKPGPISICALRRRAKAKWIPAFAGTTEWCVSRVRSAASAFGLAILIAAGASNARAATETPHFPHSVPQGSLVIGEIPPGARARYGDHELSVTPDGHVAFGVGRDETGPVAVDVTTRDGRRGHIAIDVTPRDWPIERVVGVPPQTVEPPPGIAERIKREQARVVAARNRNDARDDFLATFTWPVRGRISGRFGNQRVYVVNGKDVPKAPHSGMDIAVPEGTPVDAPAGGIVTFADPDLYLTGGTVLIDHGRGISSNFLHLSRIDVKVGQRVEQGQVIGAAGKTGRATGPHLHWGMNWFDVRLDPLLLFEQKTTSATIPDVELRGATALGFATARVDAPPARVAEALDAAKSCARSHDLALETPFVSGDRVRIREAGQPDVDLVLPSSEGVYLFWPGKKSGRAVALDAKDTQSNGVSPSALIAQATSEFFELGNCANG